MIHPESQSITIENLIQLATPQTTEEARLLRTVSQLTQDHPGLFEQLAELVYSRLTDNRAASVHEAFERLRWDIHLHMTNDIAPLLARMLLYVHPDLNGMVKLNPRPIDAVLGMRVSLKKLPGDYARRLEWCDGRPLEAPAPTPKKPVQSTRPAQAELFGEVA